MQKETKYATIWSFISMCLITVMAIGLFGGWFMPEIPVMPTSDAIATSILAGIVIPSAEDISSLIDIPVQEDTHLGVRTAKQNIAEELVLSEIQDDDFLENLADYLTNECGGIDIEDDDITNIVVKETEFLGFAANAPTWDEAGTIELEVKVYFNNDGDDDEAEKVKILISFDVDKLVYDDNYEDAEVDKYGFDLLKTYGDLAC